MLMPFDTQDAFGRQIITALRQGLEQFGWIDGRNVRIEERWIGGEDERRKTFAAELVRSSPDVIFACFTGQLAALFQETHSIPIVFIGVSDPVNAGYVASFARPGGNITGFTFYEPAMVGKWLGVLKEIAPAVTRIAYMVNRDTAPHYGGYLAAFMNDATALNVEAIPLLVHSTGEIETAIKTLQRRPDSGLIAAPDTFIAVNRGLIVELAAQYRLPTVYVLRAAVASGGLLSYSPDQIDVSRRSAAYIDRILRGESAAALPVQAPSKFELVINLKTAKALGLSVPTTLLARADEVIE